MHGLLVEYLFEHFVIHCVFADVLLVVVLCVCSVVAYCHVMVCTGVGLVMSGFSLSGCPSVLFVEWLSKRFVH